MKKTGANIVAAVVCLAIWVALVYVVQAETGWVHAALGVAMVFVARAIILSDAAVE